MSAKPLSWDIVDALTGETATRLRFSIIQRGLKSCGIGFVG
jgi:hypothetical protein